MGEYADMDVDSNIDSWRGGNWLPFWPSEAQAGKPLHPIYTRTRKVCRRCGKGSLFWHHCESGWRLHHYALLDGENEPRFVLHRCGYDSAGKPLPAPVDRNPKGGNEVPSRSDESAVLSESEAGAPPASLVKGDG
jgi:ribosomal protein S27AE